MFAPTFKASSAKPGKPARGVCETNMFIFIALYKYILHNDWEYYFIYQLIFDIIYCWYGSSSEYTFINIYNKMLIN